MLSKNQVKIITSLKQKKYRQQHGLFVAEGLKTINELLESSINLQQLFTLKVLNIDANLETIITEVDLKKISFLKTPNQALAVFEIPKPKAIIENNLIVALDDVRDPGNLGTIIRLCDWFGIRDLVCSENTVDCFNPKVIQATMGSISRVNITYRNLEMFLAETNLPVYGAFMDSENIYKSKLPEQGILIMGNEANGISKELQQRVTHRITIPRFGGLQVTESLNVATATAILLSEFKRK